MSSQRHVETRSFQEENRRGSGGYDIPFNQRVSVPVQHSLTDFGHNINEQRVQDRIRHKDTTVQWVNDSMSGKEKFRVTINIDGFNQKEVNIRVDGNKLHVYGEHSENKNDGTAKKIIEKSYELPHDVDALSPHVTFPSLTTMQVDFPSRYSNSIIDDGRTSSKVVSNYDTTHRAPPRLTQERSSTEYTSTRKLGGGGSGSDFIRSSSPRIHSSYDELLGANNTGRSNTYSSTSQYQSSGRQSPSRQGFSNSNNPTYTYRVTAGDSQPRTTYPSTFRSDGGNVHEKTFTETHRESTHRRSSPTSGVQSSREVEHNRSGSPSLAKGFDEDRFRSNLTIGNRSVTPPSSSHNVDYHRSGSPSIGKSFDEDRFRSNVSLGHRSMTPPSSSRNVEVREYSRRVGGGANNNNEPSLFAQGFNSDAFYRSAFRPEILTDSFGQKRIEMKLDVNNYEPNEIKVSVNGNDLVVQAEHNVDRPPTSSSRAYFFKQTTLPPNTDLSSLASEYHPDGRLHITAKIPNEQASIRYN